MDPVDGGLASPALAAHLAGRRGAVRPNGLGELLTQIKIATDTFVVGAIEAKHGLRVSEVHHVLNLTTLVNTFGVIIREFHRQGLQLPKLGSEADRVINSLTFL